MREYPSTDIFVNSRVWMMATGKEMGRGRGEYGAGRGRKEGGDLDRGGTGEEVSILPGELHLQFILLPIVYLQKHWTNLLTMVLNCHCIVSV